MKDRNSVGFLEGLVLGAVMALSLKNRPTCAIEIWEEVDQRRHLQEGRHADIGSIYPTLRRLVKKKLLTQSDEPFGDAIRQETPGSPGRPRRPFYRATRAGEQAYIEATIASVSSAQHALAHSKLLSSALEKAAHFLFDDLTALAAAGPTQTLSAVVAGGAQHTVSDESKYRRTQLSRTRRSSKGIV